MPPGAPGVLAPNWKVLVASRRQIADVKKKSTKSVVDHQRPWGVPNSGSRHGFLSVRLSAATVRAAHAAISGREKKRSVAETRWLLAHCTVDLGHFKVRLARAESKEYSHSYRLAVGDPVADIQLNAARLSVLHPRVLNHSRILKLETSASSVFCATFGDAEGELFAYWLKALQARDGACYVEPEAPRKPPARPLRAKLPSRTCEVVRQPEELEERVSPRNSNNKKDANDDDEKGEEEGEEEKETVCLSGPIVQAPAPPSGGGGVLASPDAFFVRSARASAPRPEELPASEPVAEAPAPAWSDVESKDLESPEIFFSTGSSPRSIHPESPPSSSASTSPKIVCLFCGGGTGPWVPRPREIALPAYAILQSKVACAKCATVNADTLMVERLGRSDSRGALAKTRVANFMPLPTSTIRPMRRVIVPQDDRELPCATKTGNAAARAARALLEESEKAPEARRHAYAALEDALQSAARHPTAKSHAAETAHAALGAAASCGPVPLSPREFGIEPRALLLPGGEFSADTQALFLSYAAAMVSADETPEIAASVERWKSFYVASRLGATEAKVARVLGRVYEDLALECLQTWFNEIARQTLMQQRRRSLSCTPRRRRRTTATMRRSQRMSSSHARRLEEAKATSEQEGDSQQSDEDDGSESEEESEESSTEDEDADDSENSERVGG